MMVRLEPAQKKGQSRRREARTAHRRTKILEADLGNVDAVDDNLARPGLNKAEERESKSTLAASYERERLAQCALRRPRSLTSRADDSDLVAALDLEGEVVEYVGEFWRVADGEVLDRDGTGVRPVSGRARLDDLGRLLHDLRVLLDTLDSDHGKLKRGVATNKEEHVVGDVEGEGESESCQSGIDLVASGDEDVA